MSDASRTCGNCTACCFVLGVQPLQKAPFQRCSHENGECSIYATRPDSCRSYRCEWLNGAGVARDRPDRLGVIVDRFAPGSDVLARAAAGDETARARVEQAQRTICAREVRRGAFGAPRVRVGLESLHAQGLTVRLIPFTGRRLPTGKPLGAGRAP